MWLFKIILLDTYKIVVCEIADAAHEVGVRGNMLPSERTRKILKIYTGSTQLKRTIHFEKK